MKDNLLVTTKLTRQQTEDLLVSAFEGGSAYWAQIEGRVSPKEDKNKDCYQTVFEGKGLWLSDARDAGEKDKRTAILDGTSIQKGLEIMADKYFLHFANVLNGNDDAETGDVFLQCCLFGEVIYG